MWSPYLTAYFFCHFWQAQTRKLDSETCFNFTTVRGCTMWVASPWGFSDMTIQPAWHASHACCLLRAGFLAFQPAADNTRGTRVEEVASSFQKILRGSQLTWYDSYKLYLCQLFIFILTARGNILEPNRWNEGLNVLHKRQKMQPLTLRKSRIVRKQKTVVRLTFPVRFCSW